MNVDYVDEALDKAGELSTVIHQRPWQAIVQGFYDTEAVVDEHGVARSLAEDQPHAAKRVAEGRTKLETLQLTRYTYAEVALTLRDGEVYAVDPEIVDLISSGAATMPSYELQMSDAPSTHGFVWFPDGLLIKDVRGKVVVVKAITWTAGYDADEEPPTGYDALDVNEFAAKGYIFNVMTDPLDQRDEYNDQAKDLQLDLVPGMREAIRWSIVGQWVWQEGRGLPPVESSSEAIQWIAAFWRFVQEPWIEHRAIAPSNAARKRAVRDKRDPSRVRVVRLRKEAHEYERPGRKGGGSSIEWSHRWVVKPFWRDQHYPSMGPAKLPSGERNPDSHRPKYIPSFVKGPKDKPLIVKDVAYLVDR
jgi:hypothetical protein